MKDHFPAAAGPLLALALLAVLGACARDPKAEAERKWTEEPKNLSIDGRIQYVKDNPKIPDNLKKQMLEGLERMKAKQAQQGGS